MFPAAQAANFPEHLVLPEPLWPKKLYHLYICPSQGQIQALKGNLRSKSQGTNPHVEVEIKPQLKHRDSVAKEEDPKSSQQLHKLRIKSTQSTRQTLSMKYIKGYWELPQQKMH